MRTGDGKADPHVRHGSGCHRERGARRQRFRAAAEYAAQQATAEAAAQHLNRVFAQAPVLIAVLTGPEHRFELVNEKGYETDRAIAARKHSRGGTAEFADQGFVELLDQRIRQERAVRRERDVRDVSSDRPEGGYFNFVFQPLSSDAGVYARARRRD